MKQLIRTLVKIKAVWWFIDLTLGTVSRIFGRLRSANRYDPVAFENYAQFERKCGAVFPDLVVRNGPFTGMRYPSMESVGSSILPKLLGSYEQEIAPAISSIIRQPYTAIVDVGCAEGYYAVGLGMHAKSAKVFAFDTNAHALDLCRTMGELNGVNVQTGGFCDKARLLELDLGDRALIFCDCEGYEIELIDSQVADKLKEHDFLIETHDFVRIDTTKKLLGILRQTHDCEIFESVDDILKAYNYRFPELAHLDLSERRYVLAEHRPTIMRWIFAQARASHAAQDTAPTGAQRPE